MPSDSESARLEVNLAEYDEDVTDAVINNPEAEDAETLDLWFSVRRGVATVANPEHPDPSNIDGKAAFRRSFGRQQTTINYSNRNWVWTFTVPVLGPTAVYVLIDRTGTRWEWNCLAEGADPDVAGLIIGWVRAVLLKDALEEVFDAE